jgi:hypothetical protein
MLSNTVQESAVGCQSPPMWAPDVPQETQLDWRTVDRALRAIRHSRAALDAEEMHWLRQAEALEIWRPLGMVSVLDYLERELGYAPRTAQDRLRVARALGPLPRLTAALAGDELAYSAVRELTRVAMPATEASWVAAAAGKNLRQIEELVAEHRPGDRPDDPPDPKARMHTVRFELAAETFALLRQARTVLDDEQVSNLSDDAFVAALCHAVLDGAPTSEPTGRAKFQIAMTVCQRCRRGWQEGAGAQIAVDPEAVDRALCDAQHIGSIDGAAPERAYQDIPPSVARFVWRRDGGRCRVPGCRSSRGLELHHLVHRADGGSHDALNLSLVCSACHLAHHRGALTITGTPDQLVVERAQRAASTAQCTAGAAAAAGEERVALRPLSNLNAGVDGAGLAVSIAEDEPARSTTQIGAGTPRDAGSAAGSIADTELVNAMSSVIEASSGAGASDDRGAMANTGAHVDATTSIERAATGGPTSKLDAAILRTQAKAALTGLGWKPPIAHAAVAAAMAAADGVDVTLERLIFESLRRCPTHKA